MSPNIPHHLANTTTNWSEESCCFLASNLAYNRCFAFLLIHTMTSSQCHNHDLWSRLLYPSCVHRHFRHWNVTIPLLTMKFENSFSNDRWHPQPEFELNCCITLQYWATRAFINCANLQVALLFPDRAMQPFNNYRKPVSEYVIGKVRVGTCFPVSLKGFVKPKAGPNFCVIYVSFFNAITCAAEERSSFLG